MYIGAESFLEQASWRDACFNIVAAGSRGNKLTLHTCMSHHVTLHEVRPEKAGTVASGVQHCWNHDSDDTDGVCDRIVKLLPSPYTALGAQHTSSQHSKAHFLFYLSLFLRQFMIPFESAMVESYIAAAATRYP